MRKQQGFTIFELMVTVVIAATITAFAIPAFQDFMARSRVNTSAEEVANSIALARNTAITRRRTVVLLPTAAGWEVRLDSNVGQLIQSHVRNGSTSLKVWQGADETAGITQMTFLPSGFVQKTLPAPAEPLDLTMRICDDASKREQGRIVQLSRIGRLTVTQNANASACNP